MSQERRGSERHARRIEVRFWRRGDTQAHAGFTTNVSTSGLFLVTSHSLQPGERLHLEIGDRENAFWVEGQVARVHRVSISLRHVEKPGAGIRFLAPAELVATLLPGARQTGNAGRERAREAVASDAVAPAVPPSAGAAAEEPEPSALPLPVVTVEFADRTGFLSVYHRDLAVGSLHVSSDVPARVQERVVIELHVPVAGTAPLRFEAIVVHRFEPRAAVGPGGNVLAGMGVRFVDPQDVRDRLAPILDDVRKS